MVKVLQRKMNFSSGEPIRKFAPFGILALWSGFLPAGRGYLVIAKKGVDVAAMCSDGGGYLYQVVRSDGKAVCSFHLRPGDRVLLSGHGSEVGHKHLLADERVTSREVLAEIVRELSARN
ncbi:hypothetical protein A8O28_18935 [Enterobacteriaceae bacterium CCUG 67584]|nr:hypothetical protein [Enterobacteriaceae bacterium CCUG 67584]